MRAVAAAVVVVASVLVASGCASSRGTKTASTPSGIPPGAYLSAAVQTARASNSLFSIFPATPGKARCAIPKGGPVPHVLHGMCETNIRAALTHEPAGIVTFTETWRRPICASALAVGCLQPWRRHVWQVTVGEPIVKPGAKLRVLATRSSGATAPQDYR
jgi:hypothetical protein